MFWYWGWNLHYHTIYSLKVPFAKTSTFVARLIFTRFFFFLVMVTHPRPPSVTRSKRVRKIKFFLRHGEYYVIHWQPKLATRYRCMDFVFCIWWEKSRVERLKQNKQIEILVRVIFLWVSRNFARNGRRNYDAETFNSILSSFAYFYWRSQII